MPSLNKVFLIGNLTRDPERRQVAGGMSFCGFGLAVNRQYQTAQGEMKEETCFVDVETWGRTADAVAQYMRKGQPIFVEGRLRYDTWEDKDIPGKKRSRLTVRAERIQFLGGASQGNASSGDYGQQMAGNSNYGYSEQTRQPQGPAYGNGGAPSYGNGGYRQPQPQMQPQFQPPAPVAPASMPAFDGIPDVAPDDQIPF